MRYKLNSGEEYNYGYGWHLKELNGVPSREHGGSIFGFKSMGIYIPSKDLYIIGLRIVIVSHQLSLLETSLN